MNYTKEEAKKIQKEGSFITKIEHNHMIYISKIFGEDKFVKIVRLTKEELENVKNNEKIYQSLNKERVKRNNNLNKHLENLKDVKDRLKW